jgi:dTDP-4-amino-4,6-dideoxygalactose transaminase
VQNDIIVLLCTCRGITVLIPKYKKLKNEITREQIRLALEKENIECRPLWKPMHLQPVFEGALYFGENIAENLFELGLCLPSGSNLTQADLESVVENIKGLIK